MDKFTNLIYFAANKFNLSTCNPNKDNPDNSFFGFPHWWEYVKTGKMDGLGNCTPDIVFPNGLFAIGFAVIDMMLYLAGILAVIFIIIGGIAYMTSDGSSERAADARKRILNAVIGLVIVLLATVVVSFIGNRLG